ncbi:putative extracellular alpha-1,3-glucanase/mutanase, partial [Sarocladium strictum]
MRLERFAALLGALSSVEAKAVFAHFMVGNVASLTQAGWGEEIALAQQAGIDGFALNIAAGDTSNAQSLTRGFAAAEARDFKLFFSFDYEAWGAWDSGVVINLVNQYQDSAAYWKHDNGGPLISTFEGTNNVGDWPEIKDATGGFFIPDWSSIGPDAAVGTGVVDGLFSWEAWPSGANDMTTGPDLAYRNALGNDRPYMMPVSPWFYTNLPGYNKNWLWRGDDLWFDRWQQVLEIQPEYVQIITWNDWGESHYIGPLREDQFGLFEPGNGDAPINYAAGMPHDGWRKFLPYLIAQYKTGSASISEEGLTTWYRRNPNTACASGGTGSGPNGQMEPPVTAVSQDKVFFSALLNSDATVAVSIGGNSQPASWEHVPSGGSGLYHGSVDLDSRTGDVVVTVSRDGVEVVRVDGASITADCAGGIVNWNAWVGS